MKINEKQKSEHKIDIHEDNYVDIKGLDASFFPPHGVGKCVGPRANHLLRMFIIPQNEQKANGGAK